MLDIASVVLSTSSILLSTPPTSIKILLGLISWLYIPSTPGPSFL